MLENKFKEIKIGSKNLNHYLDKGYDVNVHDIVIVDIMDIPYNSKMKIGVICDVCGISKEISVISYRRNIDNYGYYSCSSKCSIEKNKMTNLEKYGEVSYTKTDEYLEKTKKTKLKNHYQGTYELDFLENYYHKIGIDRGKSIKYDFNGKEHVYFPDFYISELNLLVEIKSRKWYDEHLEKNKVKEKSCIDQGYNFLFVIDKDYSSLDEIIKFSQYKEDHCWQYDIRKKLLDEDLNDIDFDINGLKIKDFEFVYIDKKETNKCKNIVSFIERYEWLGKMPNRPTHRFAAYYKNKMAGVVVMATPNSFSNLLGKDTNKIEKLISRGACASWTPKNLASSLIMWSIRWMVKNTDFRIFTAYSDTEAREIGTIYQACNFIYLGQRSGSDKLYFDLNKSHLGWTTNRNFRKKNFYKKLAK